MGARCWYYLPVVEEKKRILHVGSREVVLELRDKILRLQGFEVVSTVSLQHAPDLYKELPFDLVVVDVDGQGRVPQAEQLCDEIRKLNPDQKLGFVCNYLVSIHSDCPDEIIHADFKPEAFVEGVRQLLK